MLQLLCEGSSEIPAEYSSKAHEAVPVSALQFTGPCSALLLLSACTGGWEGFFEVVTLRRERMVLFLRGLNKFQ